ncbi:MAG: XdhC family protein, partial [Proteobacteria bacterium]|nr:XdhC family protein [Pseudomonadota bacterium]
MRPPRPSAFSRRSPSCAIVPGDWVADARAALARGATAMVTVLATEGSAPRGPGARMVVTDRDQHGSIGGGALEH